MQAFKKWFFAAAIYNTCWGASVVLFPQWYFHFNGLPVPEALFLWQTVGMCILVYAPAYWWASKDPYKFKHYIVIGFLGRALGPVGFIWAYCAGHVPLIFGVTIIFNDMIWLPAFFLFLKKVAGEGAGWWKLISGE